MAPQIAKPARWVPSRSTQTRLRRPEYFRRLPRFPFVAYRPANAHNQRSEHGSSRFRGRRLWRSTSGNLKQFPATFHLRACALVDLDNVPSFRQGLCGLFRLNPPLRLHVNARRPGEISNAWQPLREFRFPAAEPSTIVAWSAPLREHPRCS